MADSSLYKHFELNYWNNYWINCCHLYESPNGAIIIIQVDD